MLSILNRDSASKKRISITATLAGLLRPGNPAVYLYRGTLIRTTAVEAILEAAPNHVCFETRECIYNISFYHLPDTNAKSIA